MAEVCHFVRAGVKLLEFFVGGFDNFVKVNNFKFLVNFRVAIFNQFVDFPQSFSQSRVEMVLDTVVCPVVTKCEYLPLSCSAIIAHLLPNWLCNWYTS